MSRILSIQFNKPEIGIKIGMPYTYGYGLTVYVRMGGGTYRFDEDGMSFVSSTPHTQEIAGFRYVYSIKFEV